MVSRSLFVGHRHDRSHGTAAVEGVTGRRWVVLASFLAVSAATQLMWLTYAPIAGQLQSLTGMSQSQVVLLSSVFPLLYIPLSLPVGRIIDRYGFRTATLVGAGLTAAGAVLRVLSPTFAVLLIGSLVIAAGQPFVLNSATKLTAAWFPGRDAGTANGLFVASLFAGMIISLGLTPALFEAFGGTSSTSSLNRVAFAYAVIAVAAWLFFTMAGRERAVAPTAAAVPGGSWSTVKALFRIRGFPALVLAASAGIGAMIAYLQLVEELLASKGISDTTAGAVGALFVVGGAVGSFAISALADRLGHHARVFAVVLVATAVGLVAMATLHAPPALCAIGVVLTAAVAATWPLSLTLSEDLCGLATAGMSASIVLLFGNLAGVVLTTVMEQLHGSDGSFTPATVFLAMVCALGAVAAVRIRAEVLAEPSAAA